MTVERLSPIRRELNFERRAALSAEDLALRSELAELDRAAVMLAAKRRALVERLRHIHDRLWRPTMRASGRLPPRPHYPPLPPTLDHPCSLVGRPLRMTCLAVLHRHGELSLPELHSLLHLYGYEVFGPRPGKALADAMRCEVREGRAVRPQRGRYAALRSPPQSRHSEPHLPPVDPFVIWAPDRWWPRATS